MAHPPRIPCIRLPWEQQIVYFVTLNIAGRRRVFANAPAFAALQHAIRKLARWTVLAAVMMPDHIHLLATPDERDANVGIFSGLMKRWIKQQACHDWQWQKGSFRSSVTQRRIRRREMDLYSRQSGEGRIGHTLARLALLYRYIGRRFKAPAVGRPSRLPGMALLRAACPCSGRRCIHRQALCPATGTATLQSKQRPRESISS
jgi:REP element-mobilizing transposase RayT